jgi:uncharacterized cupredoxin-like copper-binding protein
MTSNRTFLTLPGVAALGLLALVGATGCGSSASGQSPPSSVTTKLTELQISPSTTDVAAGRVRISATNGGKVPHELIVIRTDKPAAGLGSGSRVSEAGSVGEVADVAPGKTKSTTLTLKPGHYVMICNLPGHYMGGMRADLTVT